MLQRHEEKDPLLRRQVLVIARHRALDAELQCCRVPGERLGLATVDVATKLVQQQDERQAPGRPMRPVIQLAF